VQLPTDGGSIVAPSNAQNLTGRKPTMGRVSLYGIIPLTYTRDHPGLLAGVGGELAPQAARSST